MYMKNIYSNLAINNTTKENFLDFLLEGCQYNTPSYHFKNLFTQIIRIDDLRNPIINMYHIANGIPNCGAAFKPDIYFDDTEKTLIEFSNGNASKLRNLIHTCMDIYSSFCDDSNTSKKFRRNMGKYNEILHNFDSQTAFRKKIRIKQLEKIKNKICQELNKTEKSQKASIVFSNYYNNIIKRYKENGYNDFLTIKDLHIVYETLEQTHDLYKVCDCLRDCLRPNGYHSHEIDQDITDKSYRDFELKASSHTPSDRFYKTACPPEHIPKEFEKMAKRFKEILNEADIQEYIRKTARFYFDFIHMHPFKDGNGRTTRLLTIMLLNYRDINLTSLFSCSMESTDFGWKSNSALDGDYSAIECNLLRRIQKKCSSLIFDENKNQDNKQIEICPDKE